jgi:NAD(P)-dependent dehydrogenase (short-subunit alcohol dehydrogenase family)
VLEKRQIVRARRGDSDDDCCQSIIETGHNMSRFSGKKAVISGGTHGMGFAIAKALLDGGGDVLLTGRNERNIDAARKALPGAHVVRTDTANLSDIEALRGAVEDKLGAIDFLFINAGVSVLGPLESVTEATYDHMFDINTKGAYFTTQRLAPLIRAGGAIVFTTLAEGPATANLSVYAGSKAAVRAFAQVFAAELVVKDIRVNAVGPGFIDTPTLGVAGLTPEARAEMAKLGDQVTPMKRHGTPDEVARAALFLAADATFTTGIAAIYWTPIKYLPQSPR